MSKQITGNKTIKYVKITDYLTIEYVCITKSHFTSNIIFFCLLTCLKLPNGLKNAFL